MLSPAAIFSGPKNRVNRTLWLLLCACALILISQPLAAKTTISFMDNSKIPQAVQENIELSLSNFSGYADCSAVTSLNEQQQRKALGKIVLASFHSYGLFATQVTQLELQRNSECQMWLANAINTEPAILSKITFSKSLLANQDPVIQERIQAFQSLLNSPFQQADYQAFNDDIYSLAIARGYFDIELNDQVIQVLEGGRSVALTFNIKLGARYTIKQVKLLNTTINQALIFNLIKFAPGDKYSIAKLNDLTKSLQQTQYFSQVLIRPDIAARDPHTQTVDIHVSVIEKEKHWLNLGAGISTDDGVRVSLTWTRPRLNDVGHSLRTYTQLSIPEQQATLTYKIPFADTNKDYLGIQAGLQQIQRNDTESLTTSIGLQRYFAWGADDWQHNVFTRYEYAEFRQGNNARNYSELLFFGASTTALDVDNPLYPTHGSRKTVTLTTAQDSLLSDQSIYKLTAQGKWLYPFGDTKEGDTYSWLSILNIGWLAADDFFTLPSTIRFYGGGDQSIRGFAFQALSPLDEEGLDTGAQEMIATQQEVFTALDDDWHVAFGVDALRANTTKDTIKAYSASIGAHWRSPVGPIRFYLSRGFSDRENTWRVHLLMGPLL